MRPLTTYGHSVKTPRRFIEWIFQATNKLNIILFLLILSTLAIFPPLTK
jgi:hypothetical protein